jgi:hypothetical protein
VVIVELHYEWVRPFGSSSLVRVVLIENDQMQSAFMYSKSHFLFLLSFLVSLINLQKSDGWKSQISLHLF